MAKSKEITKQGRELRIKSCTECNGNPPPEPYNSPPFTGDKCSICWEILTIIKEGLPIELKEKKPRVSRKPKIKSQIELPKQFILIEEDYHNEFLLL